jgi:hypothetical protein
MNINVDQFNFDQYQDFNSFMDTILQLNDNNLSEKMLEEFGSYLQNQINLNTITTDKGLFSRKSLSSVDEYLLDLYISLNKEIFNLPKERIEKNFEFLSSLLSRIEDFKVKNLVDIKKIKEVLYLVSHSRKKKFISFFQLDPNLEKEIIRELIEDTIRSGKIKNAVFFITEFNYKERDFLINLIELLASDKIGNDSIKSLIEMEPSIQIEVIQILISKYRYKLASEIYLSSGIKDENLEALLQYKLKKNLFYNFFFLHKKGKINIHQIEDLLSHDIELINLLINKLIQKDEILNALYVMFKKDFNNLSVQLYNLKKTYEFIVKENNYHYLNSRDLTLQSVRDLFKMQNKIKFENLVDSFSPITEDCYKLDYDHTKIKVVENEENIEFLEELKEAHVIGVDTEWYPFDNPFQKNCAAIMQLASSNSILIVDLISLKESERLVDKLNRVLEKKKILGFQFKSDLKMMPPKIKDVFVNNTEIINIEDEVKKKFPDINLPSLSSTVKYFFNKNLCKRLQISNWGRRPLSLRKLHYLALDAFILVNIYPFIT